MVRGLGKTTALAILLYATCVSGNCRPGQRLVGENCVEDSRCPKYCRRTLHPVCGIDMHTYANECELRRVACSAGTSNRVMTFQSCDNFQNDKVKVKRSIDSPERRSTSECNDICTMEYSPVCASNGNTYANICEMINMACKVGSNLTKLKDGSCQNDVPDGQIGSGKIVCPKSCEGEAAAVVCGTDGKTYMNECELRTEQCMSEFGLYLWHEGLCSENEILHPLVKKSNLLSSEGNTYPDGDIEAIEDSEGHTSTANVGLIIGIFVAVCFFTVVCLLSVIWIYRRQKKHTEKMTDHNTEKEVTDNMTTTLPDGSLDVGV